MIIGESFKFQVYRLKTLKSIKQKSLPPVLSKAKASNLVFRVIYAHFEKEDKIELIEIYYKGDKENEDRERILRYYKR